MLIQDDCDKCEHKPVCSIIDEYKDAVNGIRDVNITKSTGNKSFMVKKVMNMPITVKVACDHFIAKGKMIGSRMIREGEKADAN